MKTSKRWKRGRVGALWAFLAVLSTSGHAQNQPQWVWSAGKQSNDGSVTIKSVKNPGNSFLAAKNPTGTAGTVVDLRQSPSTQPPVILQPVGGDPNARWAFDFKQQLPAFP